MGKQLESSLDESNNRRGVWSMESHLKTAPSNEDASSFPSSTSIYIRRQLGLRPLNGQEQVGKNPLPPPRSGRKNVKNEPKRLVSGSFMEGGRRLKIPVVFQSFFYTTQRDASAFGVVEVFFSSSVFLRCFVKRRKNYKAWVERKQCCFLC